jgi:hypothetical protein
MSRVKQKALSDPPSQEPLEGGSDSTSPFTSNTVAALPRHTPRGALRLARKGHAKPSGGAAFSD